MICDSSKPYIESSFSFVIVKPRIDRTNLKPITVRAGKPVKYDVDVRGEPPPEITWYHKNQEVKTGENIEIVNVDYNTKLSITDSVRKNTGVWKIKAVNAHGEDEAEVEITILCKFNFDVRSLTMQFYGTFLIEENY